MLWFILQRLKSGDPEKRRQAVESLSMMDSPRALAGLTRAVGDTDIGVRVAALAALGAITHERSTELLLRAFLDPAPQVRQAAVSNLKDDGSERVQTAMANALRDPDAGVRGRAARFLDQSGWHTRDIDDEVWIAIARGRMMQAASLGAAAIQPLESVLQEGVYSQQAAVVEALGAIPDERVLKSLARALRSPDHVVCLAAIGALANAGGQDVVHELAKVLKHNDHRIRTAAIEAVARFDAQNHATAFRNLLRDPMWDVRCAAAAALAKVRDPTSVDALVTLLKDQTTDVRTSAAESLGRIGDSRAIGPLVLALKDDESEVRKAAAVALTRIDTHWAESEAARKLAPELRGALGSGDWAVRRAAAYVLEQLGESQTPTVEQPATEMPSPARRRQQAVLTVFADLLKDADTDLRLAAAETLGRLGDARGRSPLMTALKDADRGVRLAAAHALADLGVE
jgi:HEAT repeat protein